MTEPFMDITQEQVENIRQQIQGKLQDELMADLDASLTAEPNDIRFRHNAHFSDGVLKIWCEDAFTLSWLTRTCDVITSPIPDTKLVVRPQSAIPKKVPCLLHVPEFTGNTDTLRKLITRQNRHLNIRSWILTHERRTHDRTEKSPHRPPVPVTPPLTTASTSAYNSTSLTRDAGAGRVTDTHAPMEAVQQPPSREHAPRLTCIGLASAYLPGDEAMPTSERSRLVEYYEREKLKLIIAADSNAHHTLWGNANTNARGCIITNEQSWKPYSERVTVSSDWHVADKIITKEKVTWAINSFLPFKEAGLDGIFPGLLSLGKSTESSFHKILSRIGNSETLGAFIDIEGAFDQTNFMRITRALVTCGEA
ncbi:unnamed protein product [Pieris macdunnoughi]|uniref:DUF4780 domain-containing protein n=1 Tax=Pieris macdunnoughi TaxID=345717 RepID=A0A821V0J3_9NEOP|nr:unnamed protein product [Pieris macdunnoughi]